MAGARHTHAALDAGRAGGHPPGMTLRERILALDYGRVRIGLAVSDALGIAAHPLPAWRRRTLAEDLAGLARLAAERDVQRLVVGLPLNMDGSEGPMAAEARAFGLRLGAALGLPVDFEDERLSTDEAETRLMAAGLRPPERRRLRDSLAAAVILEAVLERPPRGDSPGPD